MNSFLKRISLALALYGCCPDAVAQEKLLNIEDCYALAKQHYPAARQQELIRKTSEYNIENASKGYLPQFGMYGQASYQSDVTQVPIKVPGIEIPVLTKDQYKLYSEITQTLYDGGAIKRQQEASAAKAMVETQQVEVELYQLKERINQLFFGILMIDEQLRQNGIFEKDIAQGITRTTASIANGTALKSSADVLKVELVKAGQRATELKATRKAYLDMLGLFIHQQLSEQTVLVKPAFQAVPADIRRPELLLYAYQDKILDVQRKTIATKNLPKLNFFVQAGIGKPALNLLSNRMDGYYIGGLRMSWPLNGLYTIKKEKAMIENDRKSIEARKQTFLFNTSLLLRQQNAEIEKFAALLRADNEIIALRVNIKNTASAQLEYGTITTNDYLREVNAEDQARLSRILHETQLLMAQYNHKTTTGN